MQIEDTQEHIREQYPKPKSLTPTDYFQFEEGDNRVRIVSEYDILANHWINSRAFVCYGMHRGCIRCKDCSQREDDLAQRQDLDDKQRKELFAKIPFPNISYTCYVIDRKDGKLKLAKLPYSVAQKLVAWKKEPTEYHHTENGLPKFDIKVNKDKSSGRTIYTTDLIPSTLNQDLSEEDKVLLAGNPLDPSSFVIAMQKRQMKEDGGNIENYKWDASDKKNYQASQKNEVPVIDNETREEVPPPVEETGNQIDIEDIPF